MTVNVSTGAAWGTVAPQVESLLEEALRCGPIPEAATELLLELGRSAGEGPAEDEWEVDSVEESIVVTLQERVRPYVREDGGDILFCGFDHESGEARVQLIGACSGCPSSAATLHGKVEGLLKFYVPEVQSVLQVEEGTPTHASEPEAAPKIPIEQHVESLLREGASTSVAYDEVSEEELKNMGISRRGYD